MSATGSPPENSPRDPPGDAVGEDGERSVLGSLPRTRLGLRSPRRAERARSEAAETAPADREASPEPAEARPGEADREGLARAGISFAGEAATLGFRIAGRAAAALRDAVERR